MKTILFGVYNETDINYIINENGEYLFDASVMARIFNLNLSDFIEIEGKEYINILIGKQNFTKTRIMDIDDILLIHNGTYYFHKFLIYRLVNEVNMNFYWWFDQLLYKGMTEKRMFV
jgi:uncharacterized protein with ATP-grasp and redox domains